jgi:prolyl-tRNA synthetase
MGVLVEKFADEKGIVWPKSVAPFPIHLIPLAYEKSESVKKMADETYQKLVAAGVEVLMDDRSVSAGEKFADSDLIGIPYRAIVSEKNGEQIELKERKTGEVKMLSVEELTKFINENIR